jgi:DNA-directed RNA polymerase specialized sigma24 family protein
MTRRDSSREDVTPETSVAGDPLLERLPQRLRVALLLRDRAGLSDQAIATHLRVGVAEVPGIIDEARGELRKLRR